MNRDERLMLAIARGWAYYDAHRAQRKPRRKVDRTLRRSLRRIRRARVRMTDARVSEILAGCAPAGIDPAKARYSWFDVATGKRGTCGARRAAVHVLMGHKVIWAPLSDAAYRAAQSERFWRIDEARRAFRRQHPSVRSICDSRMPGNPCNRPKLYRDDSVMYGALRNAARSSTGAVYLPGLHQDDFDHYTISEAMVEWQARRDNRVAFEDSIRYGTAWSY